MEGGAVYGPVDDESSRFRLRLWRRWSSRPRVAFVGLNPSTATATALDPTVTRCVNYARNWGFGGMEMLNLWTIRDTDPKGLWSAEDRGAELADRGMLEALDDDVTVVVFSSGPGSKGNRKNRQEVRERIEQLFAVIGGRVPTAALTLTSSGMPGHPLYLRADLEPLAWGPWGPLGTHTLTMSYGMQFRLEA